jgi:hypothetical protein
MSVLFFRERKSSYWVDALYGPQQCSFDPAIAHENKRRFTPNPVGAEQPNEIIGSSDRDAVERQKYVALLQASRCCRSTRLHLANPYGPRISSKCKGQPPRQRHALGHDPDMRTTHAPVPDDLTDDKHGRIACDGKADALRSADHRRVDADYLSSGRDERATRAARIKRRVGLDYVVDEPSAPGP